MTTCQLIRPMDRNRGPYKARSAADDTDDWPYWYVADKGGRINCVDLSPLGGRPKFPFLSKEYAEQVAQCCNGNGPCICGLSS